MPDKYIGKILNVNLSTKQIAEIGVDARTMQRFLGGQGLAIKILYDEVGPTVDPLSPNNIIVIAPGPLSGTGAPKLVNYLHSKLISEVSQVEGLRDPECGCTFESFVFTECRRALPGETRVLGVSSLSH